MKLKSLLTFLTCIQLVKTLVILDFEKVKNPEESAVVNNLVFNVPTDKFSFHASVLIYFCEKFEK